MKHTMLFFVALLLIAGCTPYIPPTEVPPETPPAEIPEEPTEEQPTEVEAREVARALRESLYVVKQEKSFTKDEYAPQIVLTCDDENDVIISGSCAANPIQGGDVVTINGNLHASRPPYTTPDNFECRGPVYNVQNTYWYYGTILCLRVD
jgi:hypothetical protein